MRFIKGSISSTPEHEMPKWISRAYLQFWVCANFFLILLVVGLAIEYKFIYKNLFQTPPETQEDREYEEPRSSEINSLRKPVAEPILNKDKDHGADTVEEKQKDDDEFSTLNDFVNKKRDLNAQEGMWRAANYLVILTFSQVLLSVASIVFLAWAIITQKKELKAANDMAIVAKNAESAYLFPFFEVSCKAEDDTFEAKRDRELGKRYLIFEVKPTIKNLGGSMARNVGFSIETVFNKRADDASFFESSNMPRSDRVIPKDGASAIPKTTALDVYTLKWEVTPEHPVMSMSFDISYTNVFDQPKFINTITEFHLEVIEGSRGWPQKGIIQKTYSINFREDPFRYDTIILSESKDA